MYSRVNQRVSCWNTWLYIKMTVIQVPMTEAEWAEHGDKPGYMVSKIEAIRARGESGLVDPNGKVLYRAAGAPVSFIGPPVSLDVWDMYPDARVYVSVPPPGVALPNLEMTYDLGVLRSNLKQGTITYKRYGSFL
jgi:hypothetical protein